MHGMGVISISYNKHKVINESNFNFAEEADKEDEDRMMRM